MNKPGQAGLWLVALLVVAGLFGLAGRLWLERSQPESDEAGVSAPLEEAVIRDSTVEPGQKVLVLTGQWREQEATLIPAPVAGPVARWHVESGALVEQGELLAELAPGELQARRGQAQARYNVTRQQVRTLRQLVAGGYEPTERLAAAEADFEAAQAAIAEVDQALERTRLYAPSAGVVEILAGREASLQAGDPVLQVVDRDPLRLTLRIPDEHAERVEPGALARIDMQGAGLLEGRVRSVGERGRSNREGILAEIELPNPDQLRPAAQAAKVRIVL